MASWAFLIIFTGYLPPPCKNGISHENSEKMLVFKPKFSFSDQILYWKIIFLCRINQFYAKRVPAIMSPKFHEVPYRLQYSVYFFLYTLYKINENAKYGKNCRASRDLYRLQNFDHNYSKFQVNLVWHRQDRLNFSQNEREKGASIFPLFHIFKMLIWPLNWSVPEKMCSVILELIN